MSGRQVRALLAAVAEPKHATLTRALLVYLLPAVWGAWWAIVPATPPAPPRNISAVLIMSGTIAAAGTITERWTLERVGIIGLVTGWLVHLLVTITTPGLDDRWDEVAIVALIGAMVTRALWITWLRTPENPWRATRRGRGDASGLAGDRP